VTQVCRSPGCSELIQAKADPLLPHGEWLELLRDDLRLDADKAERLMKIARDGRISNSAYMRNLPTSWGTLYELSKLDDSSFKTAVDSGAIHPGLEQNEARLLRTSAPVAPNWT
jgi:hypothetical protein